MKKTIDKKLPELKQLLVKTIDIYADIDCFGFTDDLVDDLNNYALSCYDLLEYSQLFYSTDKKVYIMATSTIITISDYISNNKRYATAFLKTLDYNYRLLKEIIPEIEAQLESDSNIDAMEVCQ